ncbi:hypothetical protein ACIRP3_41800 [Streptomyces sp. NPDC101209]|uniref:hypothetical protein n=1 Tax=Streptomyces sp. NPDC101209 TaxID=3366129 RepID=UPI0037F3FF89
MNSRRGPDLGEIDEGVTPEHRGWLTPLRVAYFESELSFQEIAEKAVCSQGLHVFSTKGGKGKISELLRGKGRYPRWRPVQAVVNVLAPTELATYEKQWKKGATAAGRKPAWVEGCLHEVQREPGLWTGPMKRMAFAVVGIGVAVGVLMGALTSKHFPPSGRDVHVCNTGADCSVSEQPTPWPPLGDGDTEPPQASTAPPTSAGPYVTFPPPVITPDSMQITTWYSIPVYAGPNWDRPKGFTEPHTEFYVSCRDQDFLHVAGSKYWVKLESLFDTGAAMDMPDPQGLRTCEGTSRPPVTPPASATPTP